MSELEKYVAEKIKDFIEWAEQDTQHDVWYIFENKEEAIIRFMQETE
jgi:hypothetical protein